jgi:hypothetical protein
MATYNLGSPWILTGHPIWKHCIVFYLVKYFKSAIYSILGTSFQSSSCSLSDCSFSVDVLALAFAFAFLAGFSRTTSRVLFSGMSSFLHFKQVKLSNLFSSLQHNLWCLTSQTKIESILLLLQNKRWLGFRSIFKFVFDNIF